jgi:hypothetical protein
MSDTVGTDAEFLLRASSWTVEEKLATAAQFDRWAGILRRQAAKSALTEEALQLADPPPTAHRLVLAWN